MTLLVGAAAVAALFLIPWDTLGSDGSAADSQSSESPAPVDTGPSEEEVLEQELGDLARRDLEKNITKDARKQVRAGLLDGPIKETSCREAGTSTGPATEYSCLAVNKVSGDTSEGYEYQGTVDTESGEMTWELGD